MKSQRSCLDRISTLPQRIIENILCRLPIEDVVRTSILSSNWRYNWIKIPELAFNESEFKVSTVDNRVSALEKTLSVPIQRRSKTDRSKIFNAIYQVLLLHQGPIDVFSLSLNADKTCVELDQIILHLSGNKNPKKFTLYSTNSTAGDWCRLWYRLPSSFFSLNQLTHLSLHGCRIDDQPTFKAFGSLTTLYLKNVNASKNTLLHFVSSCPSIKRFTLLISDDYIIIDGDANIAKLLDCLHSIEHLRISHFAYEYFFVDGVPKEVPTALVHLKFLCVVEICFIEEEHGLAFLGLVIRSSPNLEKLRLTMCRNGCLHESPIDLQDYSDIWLEHLKELEIEDFVSMKQELEFVKLILAKSPVLEKVTIFLDSEVTKDEEMMVLRILLCSPRASPVKIFVERSP